MPAPFTVEHGVYVLTVSCPHCQATDGWKCYPGEFPECWRCGVKVLTHGRTPEAVCVSSNGRIDAHMKFGSFANGKLTCAFCKKS